MNIGNRIKTLRNEIGISSAKMAQELDIPVRTIGSYERNEAMPGVKFFQAINKQYNVNLNWLITGKGKKFETGLAAAAEEIPDMSDFSDLIEIFKNEAAKEMIMKFIEIRKGNTEAIDELIQNLKGIKAIYG